MTSRVFSEFRFYSPFADADMARISLCNDRGHEYHITIPVDTAKRCCRQYPCTMSEAACFRQRRAQSIDLIQQAITAGLQPGRVSVNAEAAS